MNRLRHVNLIAAKHILRYLKGTVDYGLKYDADKKINLWIRIGQAVPLIGRAPLGVAGSSLAWHRVQPRQNMLPLAIWEVVCLL